VVEEMEVVVVKATPQVEVEVVRIGLPHLYMKNALIIENQHQNKYILLVSFPLSHPNIGFY